MLLWISGCQSPALQSAGTIGSDSGWTITGQAGSVSLRSPHQSFWRSAPPGARIPPDSQVVTFDGSRLEMASAGDRLTTSGPSRFTLPKSEHNGVRVRQDAGSLRYEVRSAPKRRFEVQTPHFSTVVKGTTFLISIERTGSEVLVERRPGSDTRSQWTTTRRIDCWPDWPDSRAARCDSRSRAEGPKIRHLREAWGLGRDLNPRLTATLHSWKRRAEHAPPSTRR